MKKYFPIVLVLATMMLSACSKNTGQGESLATPTKTESTTQKSIKELLGMGSSQKCSYEVNENGQKMKGEIWVSKDGKFKQIAEATDEKGTVKINVISDGTYIYYWNEAMKGVGSKMKMGSSEITGTNEKPKEEKVDINEKIDYKCNSVDLSESDFALPKDVKFVDFSETMQNLQKGDYSQLKDLENMVSEEGSEE